LPVERRRYQRFRVAAVSPGKPKLAASRRKEQDMRLDTLEDVFIEQIADLYSAEQQLEAAADRDGG
jgi:hypothetical protein